jgi:hypothetical protein
MQKGGGERVNAGERTAGTRDEHYNLISVLYHALHGAENCEVYAMDAEAAGDTDLAAFFRNAQATQRQLAEQAKERLGIRGAATESGSVRRGSTAPPHGAIGPAEEPGYETQPEGTTGLEAPRTPRDVRRGTAPEPSSSTGYVTREAPLPDEDLPPGEERLPEPPPRPPGVEEGVVPPRAEEARPPREAAARGEAAPRMEEPASPGREGARQPERKREENGRGLLARVRDALLGKRSREGEKEPIDQSPGTDRQTERRSYCILSEMGM